MDRRRFLGLFGRMTTALSFTPLVAIKPPFDLMGFMKECYRLKQARESAARKRVPASLYDFILMKQGKPFLDFESQRKSRLAFDRMMIAEMANGFPPQSH